MGRNDVVRVFAFSCLTSVQGECRDRACTGMAEPHTWRPSGRNLSCESNAFQGISISVKLRNCLKSLNLSCESNAFQGIKIGTNRKMS